MRLLVTGGAGYIGSHVVRALLRAGHRAVVLDDLKEGHRAAVPRTGDVRLVVGDIADPASLQAAGDDGPIDGVIHMAASCLVGASMTKPGLYFDNNVIRTLRLVEMCLQRGIGRFVFSSTAAVYGDPGEAAGCAPQPIVEDSPCRPTNVYGETKLSVERALDWYARCTGMRTVSLRYFNAAGADPAGDIGEDHNPETHLVPLLCKVALGRLPKVTILGRDYPTPDGTCLRDYVHVNDLASAHLLALESLDRPGGPGLRVYNLGAEKAASVLEVLEAARRITGRSIPAEDGPRRAGDPPVLLASSARLRSELGWRPGLSDLDTIIETAWRWHLGHPAGYSERPILT
ncbi:MAG TPA: UDP-glucose 4-epimerase GalE [Candidatus Polarisedimenticolia bacterium]|nr:UDP-glucose 4-epimerase GalE [Candidatus Polarisedimenticolia bacterium]